MKTEELNKILKDHEIWLSDSVKGKRANLSGADLIWANLVGTNLSLANLSGANLSGAELSWANLVGTNLSLANLSGASLRGANLSGAELSWANLVGADLSGTDLMGANFSTSKIETYSLDNTLPIKAKLYGLEYEFQIVLKLEDNSFKTTFLAHSLGLQPACKQVFVDEGNLEIISKSKQTINTCIAEINRLLEVTFKNMAQKDYFSHQFAVMLPVPTKELHNTCKHLNMTFNTNKELLYAYLFFRGKKFPVRIKEFNRLHIKLPYQFKDYTELLKGNIKAEDLIKQEWQPLLIGLASKNKRRGKRYWINKNPVV